MVVVARLLALFAGLMVICGTLFLADRSQEGQFPVAMLILGVGMAALVTAVKLRASTRLLFTVYTDHVSRPRTPLTLTHWLSVFMGMLALLVLAEMSGRVIGFWNLFPKDVHTQFALLVLGFLALAWGIGGGWSGLINLRQVAKNPSDRFYLLALGCLTMISLVLRGVNLQGAMPVFVDEVNFIGAQLDFINSHDVRLLIPINSVAAFPRIYSYLQAQSAHLLGYDLVGLRMVSAVLGALTIPAVYLLGRELFSRRVGIVAAVLIATLPIHLQFSRLGMNNIADPLVGTLMLLFLARGFRRGMRIDFAIAGLMLGMTHYFHEAGRLTFGPVVLLWILVVWFIERIGHRSQSRRFLTFTPPIQTGLVVFGCCTIVMSIPFYFTYASERMPFAARVLDVGLSNEYWGSQVSVGQVTSEVFQRLGKVFEHLFREPERIHYFAGNVPFIPYLLTPLIALGTGIVFAHWRKPGSLLLLVWSIAPLLAIAALLAEVQSPRIVVIVPPLMLLAALGLCGLFDVIARPSTELKTGMWRNHAAVLVAVMLCLINGVYYFSTHVQTFTRQHVMAQPWQDAVLDMLNLPFETEVHLVFDRVLPQDDVRTILNYMHPQLSATVYRPADMTSDKLASLDRSLNHAFYVYMPNDDTVSLIQSAFPQLIGPFTARAASRTPYWFIWYMLPGESAQVAP